LVHTAVVVEICSPLERYASWTGKQLSSSERRKLSSSSSFSCPVSLSSVPP